jgi:protocatechuate 3,4-dioxygenase beta subunit
MSLNRALVFLLLIAAAVTAVVLLNSDPDPDPVDPGENSQKEAAKTGSGGGDTQKSNDGKGSDKTTGGENREIVRGEGGKVEPKGDGLIALSGRLLFANGSPAEADLSFVENLFGPGAIVMLREPGSKSEPAKVAARSDAEGRFSMRVTPRKAGTLQIVGEDVVIVDANFGVGMSVKVGAEGKDLGDITVARAATVVGQVVAGGRGVEGVEIVYGRSPAPVVSGLFTDKRTKTDAEGRFTIRGLVPGKIRMDTRSPEFMPLHHEIEVAEGQRMTGVLMKLRQGGVITGTVVDDLGQPVEGALVSAARSRKLGTGVEYSGYSRGESTKTDSSGQFRLAGLAEASVELRANKKGFVSAREPAAKAGQSNVVMKLDRLGNVSGVLVDEKGKGIAGSDVSVQGARTSGLMLFRNQNGAKTDAEGKFVIEGVAPGSGTVVANGGAHLEAREDVEVRPGEMTKGVRLTARLGSTLTVTVLDEKGMPVVGAEVTAATPGSSGSIGNWRSGGSRRVTRSIRRERRNGRTVTVIDGDSEELGSAKTDENGVAVLRGLPAGEAKIVAKHKELALVEPGKTDIPDGGEVASKLAMQRGGFVELSVVDSQGRALGEKSLSVIGPLLGGEDEPARAPHKAGAEGRVTVGPLAPGSYKAAVAADMAVRSMGVGVSFSMLGESNDLKNSIMPFVVKASETTKVELVMPVLTVVKGTVRDAEGLVEAAEVELVPEGEVRMPMLGRYKTRTDRLGEFELKGLASGKYTLHYNRKGAVVPAEKEVILMKNQPELNEDLTLAGAVVKLRLKDAAEGFGVEEAKVSLAKYREPQAGQAAPRTRRIMMIGLSVDSGSGGGPSTFRMSSGNANIETDEHGRAEIPGVPPGKYTLTIQHPEYAKVTKIVDVVGDQVKDVGDIAATAGCKVRGKIQHEGKPGPLNLVNVEIRNDSGFRDATMSRDGTFRFTGLKAGTYKVRARAIEEVSWGPEKIIEANPDRPARVTVVVPK